MLKQLIKQVTESKDDAKEVRDILKKKLKLTSRDVSITSKGAMRVSIKTYKALMLFDKIKEIAMSYESYRTDYASGEILTGGNSFVFVEIMYKFRNEISDLLSAEFQKNKDGVNDVTMLDGVVRVSKYNNDTFIVSVDGHTEIARQEKYIGSEIITAIIRAKMFSLFGHKLFK